jgi:hypothetical protein
VGWALWVLWVLWVLWMLWVFHAVGVVALYTLWPVYAQSLVGHIESANLLFNFYKYVSSY